jgi:hypothetical protein
MPKKKSGTTPPNGSFMPGSTVKPKPTTGTIDRPSAAIEAERRYASSSAPKPSSGVGDQVKSWLDKLNSSDIEAQRRYDSSSTLPTDSRYQAPTGLNSALKGAGAPNGLSPAPISSGGSPVGSRSSGGSSGGGGGAGIAAPAVPTLEEQLAAIQKMTGTIDPSLRQHVPTEGKLALMYGQFDAALNKNRADLTKSYDESINAVKGNYAQSNDMLNAAVGKDQAILQQAAQNLGVGGETYAASPVNQNLSEALNRLVGTNGGNQAIDLSWFEKLKNLDDTNLTNWLAVSQRDKQAAIQDSNNRMGELQLMANEQARALATQELMGQLAALGGGGSGGGGGGGRRGGGRGGSGGGSSAVSSYAQDVENAELDGELDFVGLQDTLAGLPPNLQQLAIDYWIRGGATGKGAANSVLKAMDAMGPKPAGFGVTKPGYVDPRDNNPFIVPGSYNSATNTGTNRAMLDQIYQAFLGYVPGLAAIETASTTDASRRTTKNYDDTQHQPRENPVGGGLFGINPPAPPKPQPSKPKGSLSSALKNSAGRRVKVI